MDLIAQNKLFSNPKMSDLLKQNSYWFKDLNRNSDNLDKFISAMKDKYELNPTQKLEKVIDNIDLFSSVLETLK